MRLVELEPRWIIDGAGANGTARHGMGVTFYCPACGPEHSLLVWFLNPIDGGPPALPERKPLPRWRRTGNTFETLTLAPSIDASMNCRCGKLRAECNGRGPNHRACWHGFIINGVVQ